MTVKEARTLLGLRENDIVSADGLLVVRKSIENLSKVWSRNKFDAANDKEQLEAIDTLLAASNI